MANVDRVKRQLLRDLVQQNVDLAEGRLPQGLRRRRRWTLAARVLVARSSPRFTMSTRVSYAFSATNPSRLTSIRKVGASSTTIHVPDEAAIAANSSILA